MDGIRMTREIRSISPCTTIIVVTAHSDSTYLGNITAMGITHCVSKPIDHKRLFKTIEACRDSIDKKQPR